VPAPRLLKPVPGKGVRTSHDGTHKCDCTKCCKLDPPRAPAARSAIKTARFVLDERLDIAGLAEQFELTGTPDYDGDSVTFTVLITVNSLDIEQARAEGK
jgi:hypothetical protein